MPYTNPIGNWARMQTTTGGTGTLTLSDVPGYPNFRDVVGASSGTFSLDLVIVADNGMKETATYSYNAATNALTRPSTVTESYTPGVGKGTAKVNLPTTGVYIGQDFRTQDRAEIWTKFSDTDTALAGKAAASHTHIKSEVGLANVDNTSDVNKPVSTAQATAIAAKQDSSTKLTALAGLTWTANQLVLLTGSATASVLGVSTFVQSILSSASAAAFRTAIGLVTDDGITWVSVPFVAKGDDVIVGSRLAFVPVPSSYDASDVVAIRFDVATAGNGGVTSVQLERERSGAFVNVLSTVVSVDSDEKSSDTAATAAVINAANDDLNTGDRLWITVTAASTTKAKGGIVSIGVKEP